MKHRLFTSALFENKIWWFLSARDKVWKFRCEVALVIRYIPAFHWYKLILMKPRMSTKCYRNLFSEFDLFRFVILFKTADRNHHIFFSNKTKVNKRSFKTYWYQKESKIFFKKVAATYKRYILKVKAANRWLKINKVHS